MGFLAGAVAGLVTESDHVGIVLGVGFLHMPPFQAGFEHGVRYVNPDAQVETIFLTRGLEPYFDDRGFSSPTMGQIAARRMFENGADVVFGAAGYSNFGVHEAAAEYTDRTGDHVWSIGADADEYLAVGNPRWQRHILTTIEKDNSVGVELLIKDVASGGTGEGIILTVSNGAIDYSTSGGYLESIIPLLESVKADIIEGRVEPDAWPEVLAPFLVDELGVGGNP